MPIHDIRYQHWEGTHVGLWGRRLVIARNGLMAFLQTKGVWQLVGMCWITGLIMTAVLFLVGQLLVADSVVVQWAGNLNPQLQMFVRLLTTWLEEHPEISVRTTQNILFHYYSIFLLPVSIFALGILVPILITRDLASNAIIIYSSKAVSRGDYLLGKFSTAFAVLAVTWLGPICAAWFVGNLVAPDWRFFWHSRAALGHALVLVLSGMIVLSSLAMGMSSVSTKEKLTPAYWYMWWIFGGVITPIAAHTQPWLRHLSFNYNLDQMALAIFRPANDIKIAQDNIPLLGDMLRNIKPETMDALGSPALNGAIVALVVMALMAAFIIQRRVKPE
jgi:ABC-type transport system involved in multi-copper enzyme maturation permease subunit